MEPLTKATIAAALITLLTGCQSLPSDKKVFNAPSYYGKEIPSGFFTNHHKLEESAGHDLRGYSVGPRHWYF